MICQKASNNEDYEALVTEAAQIHNLTFISRVPFEEIDAYFRRAKILVSTSDSEGFANIFIQACKAGTPILSLNSNPDGFLGKYQCGMDCHGNWQQLTDGLRFMLEQQRYVQMGLNARKYAEENHDITRIVEQYKKLFIRLTGGRVD